MGSSRVRAALVLALAVASAVTSIAPAGAYHRDRQRELERLIRDKRGDLREAERREHGLLARIRASDERRQTIESRLSVVEDRYAEARQRLREVEQRTDAIEAALEANQRRLDSTLVRLAYQESLFRARVASLYMDVPTDYTVAFELVENFEDAVLASEYASSVARSDAEILAEIERTKADIERHRAALETKRGVLATLQEAAQEQADQIAALLAEIQAARDQLAGEIAARRVLLRQVQDQEAEYKRLIRSYLQESQEIEEFLRGAQDGQQAIQGRGGWLRWPVSGRITSDYGWRRHPVYGYRSFHTGIDIAAPQGTTVRSARIGEVLYTGYRGAYGLVVIVDHGHAVATVYAHLSRVYVRSGQHVATQEAIAAVGSTGWSTGPHLHFEVRVNSEPQNPMRWL